MKNYKNTSSAQLSRSIGTTSGSVGGDGAHWLKDWCQLTEGRWQKAAAEEEGEEGEGGLMMGLSHLKIPPPQKRGGGYL